MNFINLINEYLYHFFVINNMTICKLIVKFVVFLASLIKKITTFKNIYNFIKTSAFKYEKRAFFLKENFVFLVGRPFYTKGKSKEPESKSQTHRSELSD